MVHPSYICYIYFYQISIIEVTPQRHKFSVTRWSKSPSSIQYFTNPAKGRKVLQFIIHSYCKCKIFSYLFDGFSYWMLVHSEQTWIFHDHFMFNYNARNLLFSLSLQFLKLGCLSLLRLRSYPSNLFR